MTFEEGIYRIKLASTGQDLTLSGSAENASLNCKDRNTTPQSSRARQQRWMIVRAPGAEEWYSIINLYWGVVVSVPKSERAKGEGEKWVKASPSAAGALAGQWGIEGVEGGVRLKWRFEEMGKMVLDVKSKKWCRVTPEGSLETQRFVLERDTEIDSKDRAHAQWMARVPPQTPLSKLSIPATHQSIAINNKSLIQNALCQSRGLYEQMLDGLRAFDLRLGIFKVEGEREVLFAQHSFVHQVYSFAGVLQSAGMFVRRFPGETVILKISNENGAEGFAGAFLEDFGAWADANAHLLFEGNDKAQMCKVTMEQARGKIVVLTAHDGPRQLMTFVPGTEALKPYAKYFTREEVFWGNNFTSKGRYDQWTPPKYKRNFDECQLNATTACTDSNAEHVYATWWNISGIPGCMNNPVNFASRAKPWIERSYDPSVIGVGGEKRGCGICWFDFYHESAESVGNILRSNVGCADLKR